MKSSEKLKQCLLQFNTRHEFKPGQLVKWKPSMANKNLPKEGDVAIVVETIDPPLLDTEDRTGSSYYKEPLDIKLGVITDDGTFRVYHYDSSRFMPAEE